MPPFFFRRGLLACVLCAGAVGPLLAATSSSPTGAILFTRQESRQDDLYVLHLAEDRIERITDAPAKDSHGTVSPDGTRIAFNSERQGWWKIWIMDVDGGGVRPLSQPPSGADYFPTWSPDGERIAFASNSEGNGDIFTMSADGDARANLTQHPSRDNFPAWRPDGSSIAFASDRRGNWAIHLVDPDGQNARQLTREGDAMEPDWFPDGDRIAFQSTARDDDEHFHIWTLDLRTGQGTQLTHGPHEDERPSVSPDGRWIAFESDRAGGRQIFVIAAEGGDPQQVTFEGYCYGPRWMLVE